MKLKILFSLPLLAVFACSSEKKAQTSTKKPDTTELRPDDTSLVIGNPVDIGLEKLLLFPVGRNYLPTIHDVELNDDIVLCGLSTATVSFAANASDNLIDANAQAEYLVEDATKQDIRNILFYNQKDGNSYSLFDTTMHILSFAIHRDFSRPQIFYRVVKEDSNQDSIYDGKDRVVLFTSDMKGRELTQLTPDEESFVEYFYYPETKSILMKTSIDANGDMKYTISDETNFREVLLNTPAMGRAIFSDEVKNQLRSISEL